MIDTITNCARIGEGTSTDIKIEPESNSMWAGFESASDCPVNNGTRKYALWGPL